MVVGVESTIPKTVNLQSLIERFEYSVIDAQTTVNKYVANLAEEYKDDKKLSLFPVPRYKISEVEVELHFAVPGLKNTIVDDDTEKVNLDVIIDPIFLNKIGDKKINMIKFNLLK